MGWGNILRRRLKVFGVAIVIYLEYKAVQKRVNWFNSSRKNALWEKTHERNAKRILKLMIELEGLWVKLGQYLSTRADVLPEAYISVLKQLQDSLPPRALNEVRRTIQKELGKSMGELFSEFDNSPLATASIAQVHRATLMDGREVVVKVQHEGVKEVILEDLKDAKAIVDWIAWAEPQYDFTPMMDEWCREAPKELDFNHEAENTRTVSRNLRKKIDDSNQNPSSVDVQIPEVIESTDKVLVMQYMDGIRLNDKNSLASYNVDRQKLVEEITRAYAHQIYIDGFFNGDPHPGNFLVSKEPPHHPILLDFGLTKRISDSMKKALAKMFLACAEGDHVALLSAFSEMGLKLRIDMPQHALEVATILFRTSTPANEAQENIKSLNDQRERNMKALQDKMKWDKKEVQKFNPVDAFPGDAIIFMRVLNLLRGLSATLDVRVVYLEIMRPFAESALLRSIPRGPSSNTQWIYDSPVHSDVELKVRNLLLELGSERILGIQVCAYKNGNVIIDTSAGMMGKYDPRPVQPDTLFPVFSVTKGITAGLVHRLVDEGKIKFEETVANVWPMFRSRKDSIKVYHILNHTSGLHNAMADVLRLNPLLMCDWDESLRRIADATPETEPGSAQLYHYLSFGWLCGGIIEHASGKKLQELLEEVIVDTLNIHGELYIGIPPGVESRLATLTLDADDLQKLAAFKMPSGIPASMTGGEGQVAEMAAGVPVLFNTLNVRRAVIPAANGHCSARALARYYAMLAAGGRVPPAHSAGSKPVLGSHAHIPVQPPTEPKKRRSKGDGGSSSSSHGDSAADNGYVRVSISDDDGSAKPIFSNPKIHDAFLGVGEYASMVLPNGKFGLGFRRYINADGKMTSFGHSGMGGSTGFCDVEHDFAVAVTVNKMSLGGATRSVVRLVCDELKIPLPDEFSSAGERGPDMQLGMSPSPP